MPTFPGAQLPKRAAAGGLESASLQSCLTAGVWPPRYLVALGTVSARLRGGSQCRRAAASACSAAPG